MIRPIGEPGAPFVADRGICLKEYTARTKLCTSVALLGISIAIAGAVVGGLNSQNSQKSLIIGLSALLASMSISTIVQTCALDRMGREQVIPIRISEV